MQVNNFLFFLTIIQPYCKIFLVLGIKIVHLKQYWIWRNLDKSYYAVRIWYIEVFLISKNEIIAIVNWITNSTNYKIWKIQRMEEWKMETL
jgi:hypothetical protein